MSGGIIRFTRMVFGVHKQAIEVIQSESIVAAPCRLRAAVSPPPQRRRSKKLFALGPANLTVRCEMGLDPG
jgi:hypothetical protein